MSDDHPCTPVCPRPRAGPADGEEALPGAVECLEELRTMGKRLVLLSNTSKRADFTMNRIPKFGFRRELFDGGVTSGEVSGRRSFPPLVT